MKRALLALFLAAALPAQAETILNRGNGSEPETLDPAFATSQAELNILGDLMVGLTTLDARARPIPGIAERWEVSQDGLTWTFHLRKAQWSDGKPVTAQDFVAGWRRLLDPKTAGRAAATLWPVKNARAISRGAEPPIRSGRHGIRPADTDGHAGKSRTLSSGTAGAARRRTLARKSVFNGPYVLKNWSPNDRITLVRNPRFYDAANVRIDTVNYLPTAGHPGRLAAPARGRTGHANATAQRATGLDAPEHAGRAAHHAVAGAGLSGHQYARSRAGRYPRAPRPQSRL